MCVCERVFLCVCVRARSCARASIQLCCFHAPQWLGKKKGGFNQWGARPPHHFRRAQSRDDDDPDLEHGKVVDDMWALSLQDYKVRPGPLHALAPAPVSASASTPALLA